MTEENEDTTRDSYLKFQMLQQQMEQISEQAQLLNQRNAEVDISINALQEIASTKKDTPILAPIADGIFFKAKLQDTSSLIINVGENTTVEKTIPQVTKLLQEQKEELNLQLLRAESIIRELNEQAMKIYEGVENVRET